MPLPTRLLLAQLAFLFSTLCLVLFAANLYLGVGALLHALFISSTLNFYSAWTWGFLLAWPIPLLTLMGLGFYLYLLVERLHLRFRQYKQAAAGLRPGPLTQTRSD